MEALQQSGARSPCFQGAIYPGLDFRYSRTLSRSPGRWRVRRVFGLRLSAGVLATRWKNTTGAILHQRLACAKPKRWSTTAVLNAAREHQAELAGFALLLVGYERGADAAIRRASTNHKTPATTNAPGRIMTALRMLPK